MDDFLFDYIVTEENKDILEEYYGVISDEVSWENI